MTVRGETGTPCLVLIITSARLLADMRSALVDVLPSSNIRLVLERRTRTLNAPKFKAIAKRGSGSSGPSLEPQVQDYKVTACSG